MILRLRTTPATLLVALFLTSGALAQSWSAPLQVTDDRGSGGDLGRYNNLVVANGNPAIATIDRAHNRLVWLRAADADGNIWNAPITILPPGVYAHDLSVAIVNGNPAIAYTNGNAGFPSGGLMYVRANDPNGDTWGTPVLVDGTPDAGYGPMLKVVNGKPAIAYQRIPFNTVHYYVQALDADGLGWGAPVQITVIATSASATSALSVVNGYPAIAYRSSTDVTYRRALDADGTSWGTPITIAAGVSPALFNLEVIDGVPCVAYVNGTSNDVRFQRAGDADGNTWGALPTITLGTPIISDLRLLEVAGRPAVVYHDFATNTLKFHRACDAAGAAWYCTGSLVDVGSTTTQFTQPALAIVNGNPAVAYAPDNATPRRVLYRRATSADGVAWAPAVTITARPRVGPHVAQCIVSGNPALAYYDESNKDLRYIRANDALGQTWGTSVTIDSVGDVGSFCSMQVVNGQPAISYYDVANNLKYVRASDAIGTSWGTPIALYATGTSYGQGTSLAVVAGKPAIAFVNTSSNQLWFIRALDADGASWPATASYLFSSGTSPSLIDLAGVPAVAFTYVPAQDLYFVRGANVDGTAWAVNSVVDDVGNLGYYPSMIDLAGHPAISYWDQTNTKFKYAYANNVLGLSWVKTTVDDDVSASASFSSLTVIDGQPTCAYRGITTAFIRIKRAVNTTGTNWSAAPIDLTASSASISQITLASNGGDAGISYHDPTHGFAYYISGAQCGLGTPAPTNTSPPDTVACYGTSIDLSATGTNLTWTLFGDTLGTGNTFTTPAIVANYTFVVSDSTCYVSPNTNIQVTVNTVDPSITAQVDTLLANATGVLYQWLDCNNGNAALPGATDQVYTGPSGVYAVEITDGACVDTSACTPLINTSIQVPGDPNAALIHPNPATWVLNIRAGGGGPVEVTLLDADGRVVRLLSNAPRTTLLDVGDLGRGCYLVKVITATSSTVHRVVLE